MTECNQLAFEFPGFRGRKIGTDFGGGNVSSNGGLLLLRQVDRFSGLIKNLAKVLPDYRDPDRIIHSMGSLLRQRIYGLALGYEDLNDHDSLRKDLLWQSATERDCELGGSSTLCRLENRTGRKEAWLMHRVIFEQFVAGFEKAPESLYWTSTVLTIEFMVARSEQPSTTTTTTTSYHCTSFAVSGCWSVIYAPATSIQPNMPG